MLNPCSQYHLTSKFPDVALTLMIKKKKKKKEEEWEERENASMSTFS
jgi:hypothetical protein